MSKKIFERPAFKPPLVTDSSMNEIVKQAAAQQGRGPGSNPRDTESRTVVNLPSMKKR